ncbi:MAG: hypothetical protein WC866_03760 [Patescibacteria group bacterium]|jgi:hypothetical protein
MRFSLRILFVVLLGSVPQACVLESDDDAAANDDLGSTEQALSSDPRTRVVEEASFAMTGNYAAYTSSNWPTATTLAGYYYTSTDTGAWSSLINSSSYSAYGYTGFYVSCMRYRSEGHLPSPYTNCYLSTSNGYGSFEMPYYTCQGYCPSTKMRGGQCKPFMNLIAYRSGQYHGANWSFKALPSDSAISNWSTAADQMPYATYSNILPGDLLRRPYGHAAIVVRKVSSSQIVVFDSNWVGNGDGDEVVGSHTLGFSGTGNSNLGNYRVLKCVYNGGC